MLSKKLQKYNILLGSGSLRRQQFLKELGLKFLIIKIDLEENYPHHLKSNEITSYLAQLKADAYKEKLNKNDILITADTIVQLQNEILVKPKNKIEAVSMLQKLSNRPHKVITSVCIKTISNSIILDDSTDVYFDKLSLDEIEYYIDNYKPFDQAVLWYGC
jgi:septum formation protein